LVFAFSTVRDGGRLLKGCGGGGIFLFERIRRVPSAKKEKQETKLPNK
jgi:hypothetical protein